MTTTVKFLEVSGQSAVQPGAETVDQNGWNEKEYTALTSAETMEGARVMVKVTAVVCDITLAAFAQLSFSPRTTYQPYIVPQTVTVEKDNPASFTATLRAVDSKGIETDVPDAVISVSVPSDVGEVLTASPLTATGTLASTISVTKARMAMTVSCPVVFMVGKDQYEDTVRVLIGLQEPGTLEVVFDPEDKTIINPFIGNDTVTLKARVRYPDGAQTQSSKPVIQFSKAKDAIWLDNPSVPVTMPDGWVAAAIGASSPDPESRAVPPESELIIVQASDGGRIIAEKSVPIGLISPSLLDLTPDTVRLLSRGEDSTGAVSAKTRETVTLSVSGSHTGPWTFEIYKEEDDKSPIKMTAIGGDSTRARFSISLEEEASMPPDPTVGPQNWELLYKFHTRASSGSLLIEGPDLTVFVLREGLFVEKIFAVNEQNEYKTHEGLTVLPIRVDAPDKDRRRTARVKLVAMVWDGNELVRDEEAVKGDKLAWDIPVCTDEDPKNRMNWETVFSVLNAMLICTDEDELAVTPYTDLSGTWGVSLDEVIPGAGEKLEGEVEVVSQAGSVKIPLVLIFGEPPDEKTLAIEKERVRCERLIRGCIPEQYRQKLLDDLEKLPGKGARDYQVYSRQVYETAWKIWADDQKNYQYWENGWGYYLFKGAEAAKGAGDIAFTLLVGYATSAMGPAWSYFASTMASEFKDQGLECYAYYVANSDTKDFRTCVQEYVHNNFYEFFIRLSSGVVDTVILDGIDIKNPKTYTRLAWLWLWKTEQNFARNPDAGLVEAMIAAGKEVAMVPAMMLLQEFVNVHGNTNLKDLHRSVKEKGLLGGKPTETVEKKVPDKGVQKKEYEKNIKARKEDAQKDADDFDNRGKEFVNKQEKNSYLDGRKLGKEKMDKLVKAAEDLAKNPNDPKARENFAKECEKTQMDKHAMHELNDVNPGKQDKVREAFNEFWKGKYKQTDDSVSQRIADELNRNLKPGEDRYTADDIEVAKVTNTPPKSAAEDSVKSTFDRDVTYRNKRTGEDIRTDISERIYNEEFYRVMHNGELKTKMENGKTVVDHTEIDNYAHACDQTVTDRYAKDAYGGGKVDIPVAVDSKYKAKPFKDVEASAKAMEFKVQEWYDKAQKASEQAAKAESLGNTEAASRNRADAEGYKEEGIRQLTKQFKNQIEGRIDKMNELLNYPSPPPVEVPKELLPAIDIMNRIGTKPRGTEVYTVADAEAALKQMGTTPQDVAQKMSGIMESAQKNTPPEIKEVVNEYVRQLDAGERAEANFDAASKNLQKTLGILKRE
ncbi:MAG: hypothetical protein LUQ01_00960 [Methanolinea sp.]|nr:hypothetical protein [Methanolinea sp.]